MSTQEQVVHPPRCIRSFQRRKGILNVDLNMPVGENLNQEGTSTHVVSQPAPPVQTVTLTSEPIDVDGLDDDDVVISSPRAFAEAKNNSRRYRYPGRAVVVDVDSEERPSRVSPPPPPPTTTTYKRRRFPSHHPVINTALCINLEGYSSSKGDNDESVALVVPPQLPQPKEPVFSCPVCMGPLVEEMSTKCGHIFCKACIKASIAAQGKCPTCRRKITMKNTIRVYLPGTG